MLSSARPQAASGPNTGRASAHPAVITNATAQAPAIPVRWVRRATSQIAITSEAMDEER